MKLQQNEIETDTCVIVKRKERHTWSVATTANGGFFTWHYDLLHARACTLHISTQVLLPKNCIWILAESDTKQQVAAVSPNAIFFLFTVKCGVDFHLYKFMISGMLQQFFRFLTFQILPKRRRRDMPQSRRKLEQKRQLGALVFNYYWWRNWKI